MIGFVTGRVLNSTVKKVLIQVENMGIGYEINFSELVPVGQSLELYTFHNITENDQNLWGFRTIAEREYFEMLKSVNKVGASKAYALLATLGIEEISVAIRTDSPNMLAKAPGIGKKMAEQIILSLKDKVQNFGQLSLSTKTVEGSDLNIDPKLFEEASLALSSLGYKDSQVASLIKKSLADGASSSQDVIKSVLREI